MATDLIGLRMKALREERKLSQDDLARLFGFKDRQTVSAIETGERRVSAEELITAVEKLGAPLDYFTNPFLLVGEGKFSWRQSNVGRAQLGRVRARRWTLDRREPHACARGRTARLVFAQRAQANPEEHASKRRWRQASGSPKNSSLGTIPARRLADVMERELGDAVLMVDAFEGVSGAACRLPDLDAVIINRHEAPGRRHFDLAHELFHILTWDTMPPEHVEEATEISRNRVEQLANNFASALLMPLSALDRFARPGTMRSSGSMRQRMRLR